jgi:putative transcriptional regulator
MSCNTRLAESTSLQLGNRVGVSRQAINAVETGKFDPSLPLAFKLARVFNTAIEAVFQIEDEE